MEDIKKAFDGLIDEIRATNHALDQRDEIQDLCAQAMDDRSKDLDLRELDILKREVNADTLVARLKRAENRVAELEHRLAEALAVL